MLPWLKELLELGTVAHACNLTYLGDRDQEDGELVRPHLNNKLDMVAHAWDPSYKGGIGIGDCSPGQPMQKYKTQPEK
jgi:hypothetical protein